MTAEEMQAAMEAVKAGAVAEGVTLNVPGLSAPAPAPAPTQAAPPAPPPAPEQPRDAAGKFVAATPAQEPAPAETAPAPAATPEQIAFDADKLRVRYEYLGTEEEADLAEMIRTGRVTEVLQKARDQERQREKVRTLTERLETERRAAVVEGQKQALARMIAQGYAFVPDATAPDGVRIVPPGASQPQATPTPGPTTDLTTLRQQAEESGTVESFLRYTQALEAQVHHQAQAAASLPQMVDQRLAQARHELSMREEAQRLRVTFDAELANLQSSFAKAGPLASEYESMARTAAQAVALRPNATLDQVLAEARRVAKLAESAAPRPTAPPAPRAPTVVPMAGAAPAPSVDLNNPPEFDMRTPEGKAKSAEWLRLAATKALGREPVLR